MNKEQRQIIEEKALSLGFSLVSFTSATPDEKQIQFFNTWLKNKYHGNLEYMNRPEPRQDPSLILKNADTIITLATNYNRKHSPLKKGELRVASYAYGRDYHKFIKKRLIELEIFLKKIIPEVETKSFVDTGPVLERAYSKASGLGFIGKNSCLITKRFGSFVFLSEIITNIKFENSCHPSKKQTNDFSICGSCTICMDSCPTKAIVAPGQIDATKCIAYQTIENKESIPSSQHTQISKSKYVFGCDICQLACPHNALKEPSADPEIITPIAGSSLSIKDLSSLKTEEDFLERFRGSPLMRAKLKGINRVLSLHLKKQSQGKKKVGKPV